MLHVAHIRFENTIDAPFKGILLSITTAHYESSHEAVDETLPVKVENVKRAYTTLKQYDPIIRCAVNVELRSAESCPLTADDYIENFNYAYDAKYKEATTPTVGNCSSCNKVIAETDTYLRHGLMQYMCNSCVAENTKHGGNTNGDKDA